MPPPDIHPLLIEGPLSLCPWQESDSGDLLEAVRESIASVGRWLAWCHPGYELADAQAWIAHCRESWQHGEQFAFAIRETDSHTLLGGVGLNQRNRQHRSANLGYWIRRSRQGHGIAASAGRLAAAYGFAQLELIRIDILTAPDNLASRRTAERIGARFESMARHRLWTGTHAEDAAVYGLLPADLSP
jgi:RimJ/RimL family protein N-acetyltransferase